MLLPDKQRPESVCVQLDRLRAPGWQALDEGKPCQPTTGVEHWQVLKRLRVTEIGSAVGGLWPHYMESCTAGLMYFIDVTAKAHISFAAMELHSIIAHEHFQVCPGTLGSTEHCTALKIYYASATSA